jgi:hypothetical protein
LGLFGEFFELSVSVLCKRFPGLSFLDFPPVAVFRSFGCKESNSLIFFGLLYCGKRVVPLCSKSLEFGVQLDTRRLWCFWRQEGAR